MRKYHLTLTTADRTFLQNLVKKGALRARTYQRATALLELDRGQTMTAVARTLGVSYPSVCSWREKYQAHGLAEALHDKQRSGRPVVIDGQQRAKVTALACSTPPQGHVRWTLRLLADKAVELGHCEQLSHTHARRILKKTPFSRT
jgi:putative transposase